MLKHTPSSAGFAGYLTNTCGKSLRTAKEYVADLASFEHYCGKQGRALMECVEKNSVSMYLLERTGERRRHENEPGKLSQRSAARAVSSLKAYAQYLVYLGHLPANPLSGLKAPKFSARLPVYLNASEVISVVSAYDGKRDYASLRNGAVLKLIYSAGLRVSECAGLDLASIRPGNILRVLGKGSKEREVPYGGQAASALENYLAHGRPGLLKPGSKDALWLNRSGGRLSARAMRNILDKAALMAGVVKPLSPHKLRHACATHMLEGGAEIRLLQEFLGHASLNTTQVYTQITRTQLLDTYLETHPRAKK